MLSRVSAVRRPLAAVRRMPALAAQLPLTLHLTRPRDPHGRFKVVVLSGGTGVGKTALSLQLAKELDGEIVSADSMQVYQGLNIGTAKASREEMSSVPHHLIDFIPLGGPDYSAARFHRDAMAKIKDIASRGKTPIIVGGTGLYLHYLLFGLPRTMAGPGTDDAQRTAIEREADAIFHSLPRMNSATAQRRLRRTRLDVETAGLGAAASSAAADATPIEAAPAEVAPTTAEAEASEAEGSIAEEMGTATRTAAATAAVAVAAAALTATAPATVSGTTDAWRAHMSLTHGWSPAVLDWLLRLHADNDGYRLRKALVHAVRTQGTFVPDAFRDQALLARPVALLRAGAGPAPLPQSPLLSGSSRFADAGEADEDPSGLVHIADPRCFYLSLERTLHARVVDRRCEDMLRGGLLDEVLSVVAEPGCREPPVFAQVPATAARAATAAGDATDAEGAANSDAVPDADTDADAAAAGGDANSSAPALEPGGFGLPAGSARAKAIGYAQALSFFRNHMTQAFLRSEPIERLVVAAAAARAPPAVTAPAVGAEDEAAAVRDASRVPTTADSADAQAPKTTTTVATAVAESELVAASAPAAAMWAGLRTAEQPAPALLLRLLGRFLGEFQRGTRSLVRRQAAWVRSSGVFYEFELPVTGAGFMASHERAQRPPRYSAPHLVTGAVDVLEDSLTADPVFPATHTAGNASGGIVNASDGAGTPGKASKPRKAPATALGRALAAAAVVPLSHITADVEAVAHPLFGLAHRAAITAAARDVARLVRAPQKVFWDGRLPRRMAELGARLVGEEDAARQDTAQQPSEEEESAKPADGARRPREKQGQHNCDNDKSMRSYVGVPYVFQEKNVVIGLRGPQLSRQVRDATGEPAVGGEASRLLERLKTRWGDLYGNSSNRPR